MKLIKRTYLIPIIITIVLAYFFVILKNNQANKNLTLIDNFKKLDLIRFDFETENPAISFLPAKDIYFEGLTSAYVAPEMEYGPTIFYTDTSVIPKILKIDVNAMVYTKMDIKNVDMVFSIEDKNGALIWKSFNLSIQALKDNWKKANFILDIEQNLLKGKKNLVLKIYPLNKGQAFYMDNIDLQIYTSLK